MKIHGLALAFALVSHFASAEIVFVVSHPSAMPMAEIKDGQLIDGMRFDAANAIAHEMKQKALFLLRPRKRLENTLVSGEADIACIISKEWVEKGEDSYHWTPALYSDKTLVVGAKHAPPIRQLEELQGKAVGGVLGFSYPGLDKLVKSGKVIRDDALDLNKTYLKLINHRFSYMAVNKVEHDYHLKISGQRQNFNDASVLLDEFKLFCALSKKSSIKPAELDQAVSAIVKRGLPEQWLAKYR
jgi:polar amino acid transport system substrate-binding protein